MMMAEHIITYIFRYVSDWNVYRYGEANELGIESTSVSIVLDSISLFLEIILSIMVIIHLTKMGGKIHNLPLLNYFMIANMMITFLLIPYSIIAKRMLVEGEIAKNLFTLYQV